MGDRLEVNPHPFQAQVLTSRKRIVVALGGTQSGKTVIGPYWLYQKMQELGPGDYLVVGPYSNLLHFKVIPEFERLFCTTLGLGKIRYHPFILFRWESPRGEYRVFFGHARNSDTLESATAKAAWLDEAGQDAFTEDAWEAIRRRLSLHQGPVLITTTPYNFGWLYRKIYLPWERARREGKDHPSIEVVQFDSVANPAFPREEWEEAQRTLPRWKFEMFYRGRFTRPAGLVYESFSPEKHVRDVEVSATAATVVGVDFGEVNMVAIRARALEGGTLYVDRWYKGERLSIGAHAENIRRTLSLGDGFVAYGGSKGEEPWRRELTIAGLPVQAPPVTGPGSVMIGIDLVNAYLSSGRLLVSPSAKPLVEEFLSYSWKLDESGEPIPGVIDDKQKYHFLDALRYAVLGADRLLRSGTGHAKIVLTAVAPKRGARGKRLRSQKLNIPPQFIEGAEVAIWRTKQSARRKS